MHNHNVSGMLPRRVCCSGCSTTTQQLLCCCSSLLQYPCSMLLQRVTVYYCLRDHDNLEMLPHGVVVWCCSVCCCSALLQCVLLQCVVAVCCCSVLQCVNDTLHWLHSQEETGMLWRRVLQCCRVLLQCVDAVCCCSVLLQCLVVCRFLHNHYD